MVGTPTDVIGAFPGTFDPPTVAHLAIAEAVHDRHRLDRVDLIVSRVPLGKGVPATPTLDQRLDVLRAMAARVGWLGVVTSDRQLIVELVEGYDVVVMGADKWRQVHDPAFYAGSAAARDDAVAALPIVAVAPRAGEASPAHLTLDVDPALLDVSSTLARAGRRHLMVREAAESGLWG